MDALAASPFALLNSHSSLRLVTDVVHEDDALCLALACRALRDALWARFPVRPAGDAHAGKRLRTEAAALVGTVARVVWARGWAAAEDEVNAALGEKDEDRARVFAAPRLSDRHVCELAAQHGALATLR
jgi:hypothetical protein